MTPTGTLYIVGGQQKAGAAKRPTWQQYECGRIVAMDMETGSLTPCVDYRTPPELAPQDDPSILFKAGTLVGDVLHVCTTTELLSYRVPTFELLSHTTHAWLNDVHHVRPTADGTLLVANTGLDQVVELEVDGTLVDYWSVTGKDTFDRFDREIDYRLVGSTKPHEGHPNYVFECDGSHWVTIGKGLRAVCLEDPDRTIEGIGDWTIHDGVLDEHGLYFTAVDGNVTQFDPRTLEMVLRFDLADLLGRDTPMGWCRGIEPVAPDYVVVAFSRLRPTLTQRNIMWVKRKLGGAGWGLAPTRVVCVDLRRRALVWERDVESAGLNAIFSMHFLSRRAAAGLEVSDPTGVGRR